MMTSEYVLANNARQEEFSRLDGIIYMDNAGSALYSEQQIKEYTSILTHNLYGNPHSMNASSQLSTDTIEQVRKRVLTFLGTSLDEYSLIFTSGSTAALKLLAESFNFGHTNHKTIFKRFCDNCKERKTNALSKCCTFDGTCVDSGTSIYNHVSSHCKKNRGNNVSLNSTFLYTEDNHTSVIGMREVMLERDVNSICILYEDILEKSCSLIKDKNTITVSKYLYTQLLSGITLFVYPAQSNFNGQKYPLRWIEKAHCGCLFYNNNYDHPKTCWNDNVFVCLDAASYLSTSPLDLRQHKPDFMVLSFYKIFGFPTGLGALLVKNSSCYLLTKRYFGGGTVDVVIARENFHSERTDTAARFEDGTVSFLDILALNSGFDAIERISGSMKQISDHTYTLARFVFHELQRMHHETSNTPVVKLYHLPNSFNSVLNQGPIIAFNIIKPDSSYLGYSQVNKLSHAYDIHLRTGCFCNTGACQYFLGLTSKNMKDNFKGGHVCGDNRDLISGQPTGCCRISFGYYSNLQDALVFLDFITVCFQEYFTESLVTNYIKDGATIFEKYLYSLSTNQEATLQIRNSLKLNSRLDRPEEGNLEVKTLGEVWKEALYSNKEINKFAKYVDTVTASAQQSNNRTNILTNIFLYPVKSCGAFEICEWPLGKSGLMYDREWMIVTELGICLTQKREPRLCLIKPVIDLQNNKLRLSADGHKEVSVSLSVSGCNIQQITLCQSKVCGDSVKGLDCGDVVATWLQKVLNHKGLRLIRKCADHIRRNKTSEDNSSTLSFANEAELLLVNRASCEVLDNSRNHCLESEEEFIRRFRANLVIQSNKPLEEKKWATLKIGSLNFKVQGECLRCAMICVNQTTGEKNRAILKDLLKIDDKKKIKFGIYLRLVYPSQQIDTDMVLSVGDHIHGLEDKT